MLVGGERSKETRFVVVDETGGGRPLRWKDGLAQP